MITVHYTGVAPGEEVNIKAPVIPYEGGVLAGMYNFDILGSDAFAGSYKGYCVDPQYEQDYFPANIIAVTDGSQYEGAAYLLSKYYADTISSNQKAAQVQLAIWELVWDFGGGYNLGDGNFQTGSYTSEVNALITEATGALAGFTPSGQYVVKNDTAQDFMFQQVPEPTTILLLGLGLIGISGIRRKFSN